jgi:uncharacterized protein YdbL (DUF1318 family)
MRGLVIISTVGILFGLGCARVRVEAPKDPIKVDISMRLDVYQHVAKDIDDIEGIVSGGQSAPAAKGPQSSINLFLGTAFAEGGVLDPEVEQAALRRRDRKAELVSWEAKGVIGENRSGLVEIRGVVDPVASALVQAENTDRVTIYESIAKKNGTSLEEVKKLYAKRLQNDAPAGTPIEAANESGSYGWKTK